MNFEEEYTISPTFRFSLWGMIALIVIGIAACFIFKTEITVKGLARTLPEGDVWKIYAQTDGIVKEYNIYNGKEVKQGDILITLEDDVHRQNISNIEKSIKEYTCLKESYDYLLSLKDDELYGDVKYKLRSDECVAFNVSLHHTSLLKRLIQLQLKEKQYNDKIQSLTEEKTLLEDILTLSRDNFERQEKLYAQKLTTLLNFEQAQQSYLQIKKQFSSLESDISNLQSQLKLSQKERETEISNSRYAWSMNGAQFQQDINEQNVLLSMQKDAQNRSVIIAPIDGIIDNKSVNGKGDIVNRQVEIASIIPQDQDLIVRADFLNRDIGLVNKGQKAWIKLDAFPMERYELLEGEVTHISSESVLKDVNWFYGVDIRLNQQFIRQNNSKYPLKSGLTGEVDIVVGKRRLISFLFEPIFRAFYEVAKEP